MRTRILALVAALTLAASLASAQTSTPTPTSTRTPTATFTASNTPTSTFTPTLTRTPVAAAAQPSIALVVPSGGTTSNWIRLNEGEAVSITVFAPATLAEVATFEVSDEGSGGTWRTFQYPIGTDTGVAAGKAVVLPSVIAGTFRIKLAGSAAASRAFVALVVRKAQ